MMYAVIVSCIHRTSTSYRIPPAYLGLGRLGKVKTRPVLGPCLPRSYIGHRAASPPRALCANIVTRPHPPHLAWHRDIVTPNIAARHNSGLLQDDNFSLSLLNELSVKYGIQTHLSHAPLPQKLEELREYLRREIKKELKVCPLKILIIISPRNPCHQHHFCADQRRRREPA